MTGRAQTKEQSDLVELSRRVMPGGSFGNLPAEVIIREGRGGRVRDESGNEYIDFVLGSGPMLLGHAHPEVVAAVQEQVARGSTFFANNSAGIRLAEAIVEAMPCADKVRFLSSGTEATHYAMRLARAYRKRDKIMKFEGGFHGMGDWALMSMAPKRPGNFPQATPDSPGIPRVLTEEMLIAPFNDAATATAMIEEHRDELAGVILEPFQRLIPPKPGFLEALRTATAKHGIPLIFDEIVTGFRFAYGGAQEYYGVVPDIAAIGKVVGGGYPLAAVAGREEIMRHFDKTAVGEEEFVPQTGTLSGNPVAAVAGLATLEVLRRPGTYEKLFATGRALMAGYAAAFKKAGIVATVIGEPPLFEVFFTDGDLSNYRATLRSDIGLLRKFNALLLERGVLKPEVKLYVSLAHTAEDVSEAIAAFEDAARELAKWDRARRA
jgi:glutamate-1-semialdehyde 2,1-aminomutase